MRTDSFEVRVFRYMPGRAKSIEIKACLKIVLRGRKGNGMAKAKARCFSAKSAVMRAANGWGSARAAGNGVHLWKSP